MDRTLEELASAAQAAAETLESKTHSMEFDMCLNPHIVERVRNDRAYAQNLYAALCNNEFQLQDPWYILQGRTWACSWRSAGGIVADIRGEGDYMDWYCSGMGVWKEEDGYQPDEIERQYVPEGMITEEIQHDLAQIGWRPVVDQES